MSKQRFYIKHTSLRLIVLLLACPYLAGVASAQDDRWYMGLKAGINITDFTGSGLNDSALGGGNTGAVVIYNLRGAWSLLSGLEYSMKGAEYNRRDILETQLNYVELPMLLMFNFRQERVNPRIFAGITGSALLTAKNEQRNNTVINVEENYRNFELGVAGGAGLSVAMGDYHWLLFDLRYHQGVTGITRPGSGVRNRGLSLNVMFVFSLKSRQI